MKKKIIFFLLALSAALVLTGCGKKQEKSGSATDGEYVLYYLNIDGDGLTRVEKKLDLPEDTEAAVRLILEELNKVDKKDEYKYTKVLNDQILVDSIHLIEEGEVVINFGSGYTQMNPGREILVRAAIVKSLMPLDGVSYVSFTIDDEPLTNEEGIVVDPMSEDTFVLDDDRSEVYNYTETVTLYMANKTGDGLVEVSVDVEANDNQSLEEAVLEALKENYGNDTISPIPKGLTFHRIHVLQKICYVDLSTDILTGVPGVDENIKVYSMVNTLTSLSRINQVQFTIDGELVPKMNDVSGFDSLMSYDYYYLSEANQ